MNIQSKQVTYQKRGKKRKNAGNQVMIGLRFASEWFRR